jgi:hypothetical protein
MGKIPEAIRRLVGGDDRACDGQVGAIWNGAVLAESDRPIPLEGHC